MYEEAERTGIVDKYEAYAVGLLHDIGYIISKDSHETEGALLLKGMGLRQDLIDAIMNHGTNPYKIRKLMETNPMLALLQEADMSVNKYGDRVGFDGRLDDIAHRYGADSIAYKTAESEVAYAMLHKRAEKKVHTLEALAKKLGLDGDDLFKEAELVEEEGSYINMALMGYSPEELRSVAEKLTKEAETGEIQEEEEIER
jgi:hypothetical protein